MTIRWQTRNDGTAAVSALFHERIVVTNGGQTLLNTTATYDVPSAGSIGVGAAVARSYSFTLPDGTLGAGTLTVAITTDSNNEVVEGFSGTTPETNNTTAASFTSSLRPYPDLVVSALSVSPAAVQTGSMDALDLVTKLLDYGADPNAQIVKPLPLSAEAQASGTIRDPRICLSRVKSGMR